MIDAYQIANQVGKRGALLALCAVLAACGTTKEAPEKSLYDRLGGEEPIRLVVTSFVQKLVSDPVINGNPVVKKANEEADAEKLITRITEMLCQAAGGPQKYKGGKMKPVHEGMGITQTEWDRMTELLVEAMDEYEVPDKEQAEVIAIVDTTEEDIVEKPNE